MYARGDNLDDITVDPDELTKIAMWIAGDLTLKSDVRVNLMNYARTKADAMRARFSGNILRAFTLERRCDKIYDFLPEEYRW